MLNLWLYRNRLWACLFAFILIIKISSAVELGISPPELAFETKAQEAVCQNLAFFSSYENLSLTLSDKWALKNKQTKNPADYSANSSSLGISIDYPKKVIAEKKSIIKICITADKPGVFQGILFFETEQSVILGTWIHLDVSTDKNEKISLKNLLPNLTGFISEDSLSTPSHKWLILESIFLLLVLICLAIILKNSRKQSNNFAY